MKLGTSALLEIMSIVLEGLSEGKDISDMLRAMDLVIETNENGLSGVLVLSEEYIDAHPRAAGPEKN